MHNISSHKKAQQAMKLIIKAGKIMLCNGAEIYRVEDTMERMFAACQNISDVQVECTYSSIIVSFYYDGEAITSLRKIKSIDTNMVKIADINNFSREFVSKKISLEGAILDINEIDKKPNISPGKSILLFALISSAFTASIGGSFLDVITSFFIVGLSQIISYKTASIGRKYFMDTLMSAFIITSLAFIFGSIGANINSNNVAIGSIFMLFPGISLTNSVRDFMNRDLLAGTIGMLQAIFIAAACAIGVGVVILIYARVGL